METITLKKEVNGHWFKRFDDYEKKFLRIKKEDALANLTLQRKQGNIYDDDGEPKKHRYQQWSYQN